MILKFKFNQGRVVANATAVKKIDSPNMWGGIGDVHLKGAIDSIWTGEVHLRANEIRFSWSQVREVLSRSSLNEDDEPWEILINKPDRYDYESAHLTAAKLKSFLRAQNTPVEGDRFFIQILKNSYSFTLPGIVEVQAMDVSGFVRMTAEGFRGVTFKLGRGVQVVEK